MNSTPSLANSRTPFDATRSEAPAACRRALANPDILKRNPYKPGRSLSQVKREFGLERVAKLASNENPAGPSPRALAAIQGLLPELHLYPDDSGVKLKSAIAERLGVDTHNVTLGHGATEILEIIVRTFVCRHEAVISAHPSFPWFRMLGDVSGAENVLVPLRHYTHDLHAMAARITSKTKLIFVANPNNPTGTIVTQKDIESFMRVVPDHVVVVFDEAYIEYVAREQINTLKYIFDRNVIVVRTFSKISGLAGLRIGYAIADAEIIELLEKVRQPFNTTMIAQMAATASLDDLEHLENSRQAAIEGREYLYPRLSSLGLTCVPSEANFVFVDFGRSSEAVFEALLPYGLIIRPMLNTFARITIGSAEENKRLIGALEQVLDHVSST